jgi:CBS domain-containing protein
MRPITASDLMNPEVLRVRGDMTIEDLAAFLLDREISGAPVEDDAGRIVGVVSLTDVVGVVAGRRTLAAARAGGDGGGALPPGVAEDPDPLDETFSGELDGESDRILVRDVMTVGVEAVPEHSLVPEVAARLLEGHLHRLLVTRGEEVVGILSTSDLLGLLVTED